MRPRMGTGMVVSFSGYVLHIFHKPSVGQARIVISGCSDDGMSERSEVEASTSRVGPQLDRIEVFVSNEHVSLSGVVPGAVCVMKSFKRILSKAGDIYCTSMPSSMVLVTDIRHVANPTWSPEKFLWPAYAAALKCGKKRPRPSCVRQIQQQAEGGAVDKRAHVVSGQLSGLIRVDLAECSCLTQSSVTLTVKLRFDDTTGKIVVKADGRAAWDLLGLHPSQGDPDFRFLRNLAAKHSRLTAEAPKSEEPETKLAIRAAVGVMPMEDATKLEQLLVGKCIFAAPQVLLLGQKVTIPACRGFAAMVDLKVLEVQPISHQHHLSLLSDQISACR